MDTTPQQLSATTETETTSIPRWLHGICLGSMGILLTMVVLLVVAFLTAGPEESLAGLALIFAALLAVPLLATFVLWSAGRGLRRRSPRAALVLVIAGASIGVLTLLLVGGTYLPSI